MVWSSTARNIGSMMEGNTAKKVDRRGGGGGPALWPEEPWPGEPWPGEPWPGEPWPEAFCPFGFWSRLMRNQMSFRGRLEHDPEKLQTFRTRSCSKSKTSERYPIQPETIALLVRHQYRQRRTRQDVPCRPSEYHLAQPALGIGALHQEIAAMRSRVLENGLPGGPLARRHCDGSGRDGVHAQM